MENCREKTNFKDPRVTRDVTGQVKVGMFHFSGLVTAASKISMLSSNKANESAWIVSLIFVSISFTVLYYHNIGKGHLRSTGQKGKKKEIGMELKYMFLGQISAKNTKNDLITHFEASKSVKIELGKSF